MLGRKQIENPINQGVAPARSSLVDVAWAVEERIVWGGADVLRTVLAAIKWPFEQLAWASERWLIWPLQERTDHWSTPLRAAATAAVAAIAVAAVIGGALLAKGPGEERSATVEPVAVAPAPAPSPSHPAPETPVLQGATPNFTPEAAGSAGASATSSKEAASSAAPESAASSTSVLPGSSASTPAGAGATAKPGPAATKVVRRFAGAFVLYETGRGNPDTLRAVFAETATPQFAHSLLKRPPRLPADVKVPKAKVLNVVAGPAQGNNTFSYSISLLRLGVTSELRVDVQCNEKSGKCLVTEALG